jgi:hypothetical protein
MATTDKPVTLEGRIERRLVERGTKSEHHAMVLVSDGKSYPLQRVGGNPFRDPYFDSMEGQQVKLTGWHEPGYFLVKSVG